MTFRVSTVPALDNGSPMNKRCRGPPGEAGQVAARGWGRVWGPHWQAAGARQEHWLGLIWAGQALTGQARSLHWRLLAARRAAQGLPPSAAMAEA
jgi:hypothetical protein